MPSTKRRTTRTNGRTSWRAWQRRSIRRRPASFSTTAPVPKAVALFTGVPDDALERYGAYYATRNEWMRQGGHELRPGHVIHGDEMCEPAALRRTEFYNDYLALLGIGTCIGAY